MPKADFGSRTLNSLLHNSHMSLAASDRAQATDLQKLILKWYSDKQRDLAWRKPGTSPWGVLVSETMLQQTPVNRVEPEWIAWMNRWPTPEDLARATTADVIRAWGRMGYPRRALRLHESATMIIKRFGGQVPATYDELRELPGVGDYTASAVLAFAYKQRAVVLDTNVRRVFARLGGDPDATSSAPTKVERDFGEKLLPRQAKRAATWSVAVMELGSLICTARAPKCTDCPVAQQCEWFAKGEPLPAGPSRKPQRFEGSDRQVRGLIMHALRESPTPVSLLDLESLWPDQLQFHRALDGLVSDGLVEPLARKRYQLPN